MRQPGLFEPAPHTVTNGELTVIHIEDGRSILSFKQGAKAEIPVELLPEDRQWLIKALSEHPWEMRA